jgi:uncharacterized RmlC-like cupin family protein
LVAADDLTASDPTPGMSRRLAAHETTLYIVSGRMRMESGPGGRHVVEAGPGDFLRVPAGAIHRETNPSDEPGRAVIVRCGSGEPTVNVDGPAG